MFVSDNGVKDCFEAVVVVEKTIEWLNNLERKFGTNALLDNLPNNFSGRYALQDVINFLALKAAQGE